MAREQDYLSAAKQLTAIIQKNPLAPAVGALTQTQAQMVNAARDSQVTASTVAATLEKLEQFELIQAPTFPLQPEARKIAIGMLVAATVTGFGLVLFVWLRAAWRKASLDPNTADKVRRIQAAWLSQKKKPAA